MNWKRIHSWQQALDCICLGVISNKQRAIFQYWNLAIAASVKCLDALPLRSNSPPWCTSIEKQQSNTIFYTGPNLTSSAFCAFFVRSVELNATNILFAFFMHHKLINLDEISEPTTTLVSHIQLEKVYWYILYPGFSSINCFWNNMCTSSLQGHLEKINISTEDILQKCQQVSERYEKRTNDIFASC